MLQHHYTQQKWREESNYFSCYKLLKHASWHSATQHLLDLATRLIFALLTCFLVVDKRNIEFLFTCKSLFYLWVADHMFWSSVSKNSMLLFLPYQMESTKKEPILTFGSNFVSVQLFHWWMGLWYLRGNGLILCCFLLILLVHLSIHLIWWVIHIALYTVE